jgi:ABC-type branched-subunit amino acid transport system ATPase component/ABC-type branched-subunit amino acid transport system permease subunit
MMPGPNLLRGPSAPLAIVALAMLITPAFLFAIGLTLTSATDVVIYAIAAMALNVLVGYTGLTSFGHGAWFGLGAYAAALAQKYWFAGGIVLPVLFAVLFIAALSAAVGFLILRRRGVYFSLLTLAFTAMVYAVAFRWTAFTGGESGLGGVRRPAIGPLDFDDALVYLVTVSLLGFAALYGLLRFVRSPVGTVLVAIRENEQRAQFIGYDTTLYKLAAFVVSATITGFAGILFVFHHRFASADPASVGFSGELLAIVVIGGMRSFLGPALGALFYVLFREFLSIWTPNWLFYFGLLFVLFILYSPTGLIGVWERLRAPYRKKTSAAAAMDARRIHAGMALPASLVPRMQGEGAALEVREIAKSFGGIHAVTDMSLTLHRGEIHALIGPNGAGKTTAFNVISGLFAPDRGAVLLNGTRIDVAGAAAICQLGLARSFQITNLFKGLTVRENLRLAVQATHPSRFSAWRDAGSIEDINRETGEVTRYLGLDGTGHAEAGSLSYGGQRLLDLGIALSTKPGVLLLDEPLAGLAAAERERVGGLVKTIARDIPILIVEHDIDRVLEMAQRVTVMNEGSVLLAGTPDQARNDRRVQEVYTGTGTPPVTPRSGASSANAEELLRFANVDAFYGKSHILQRASLLVREGEIVGLLGRNGAGKSTLLKTLTGLVPVGAGEVSFAGQRIDGMAAADIARLGIAYVPQGRGLFAGMSVRDNLQLGRLARHGGGSSWSDERIFQTFPRLRQRLDTAADFLSGGEQQMVAVARALSGNARLLLLDEPFEGLAPAVVQELFGVFDRLRSEVSIVIVEHNLDLALALADRAYVLERGAVIHEGPAEPLLRDIAFRKSILWL